MSDALNERVALAEAAADDKQAAEERAAERFHAAQQRDKDRATQSPEFHAWMAARHETDAAWGAWAMAMDARQAA